MSKKKTSVPAKFFTSRPSGLISDILTMYTPIEAWMDLEKRITETLLSTAAKSIMLLGGPDTGKTALAAGVVDLLSEKGRAGLLDLDMGQAHIGPPSTIAWGLVEGGFKGWENIKAAGLYFTGALSPPGNMLPSLTGAKLLMESAQAKCSKLIIDTTGLVAGPIGRLYKQYKIDLLRPDVVLAVQKNDELEHIISPYALMRSPVIIRLKPSTLTKIKGIPLRTGFRAERFRVYFEGSRVFEVDMNKCGVRYTRDGEDEGLEGRLLSFRDHEGTDICLGVIEKAALDKGLLTVRSPLKSGTEYACIIIGRATAVF
jgi:polynucleotide 5'-hydroxyl-kinase GRC3/NOL9